MTEDRCPFCDVPPDRILIDTGHVRVVADQFPVTRGHALVLTRRHVTDLRGASDVEVLHAHRATRQVMAAAERADDRVSGFNVGANAGRAAGQTVDHLHWHVIPRRDGDVVDPRGGIRGVFPDRRVPAG